VAIGLNDSAGLAGMLQPGDRVGVTAVIFGAGVPGAGQGAFAKTISGGFRVLYISPDFRALDPLEQASTDSGAATSPGYPPPSAEKQESGTVILAVPIEAEVIAYDFTSFGVESATRLLNVVDLLPALDHAQNVALSLFLEPDDPVSFVTSGIYLPDLVITPGPSPTPTETPTGYQPILTTPTPTP
jgi:pilus assembly protein CpaB